ncbi:MAG: copper amine oxidase N-terminal domain-containing protein [Clostridia bacterium]|nr:copper amine oxidase N-terminal domain-containing protein [Clostridia bacterium]
MKKSLIIMLVAILTLVGSIAFAQEIDLSSLLNFNTSTESTQTSIPVSKDAVIRVQLNGNILDFKDAQGNVSNPKIINNRTMVPMRKIFETFNASVDWNEDTKTVVAKVDNKEITLTIGDDKASIKDLNTQVVETTILDQSPVISENRTLVPIRFIAEGLNKEVAWDNDQRAVIIIDNEIFLNELKENVPVLQKLFTLNLGDASLYASASSIQGRLSYIDTENNNYSETIALVGSSDIKVNGEDEMEAAINFTINGNDGKIMASLKEQKYDNFDAKIILKAGKIYIGIKENDQYKWTDVSESMNSNQLPTVPSTINKLTSYKETLDYIKSFVGETNLQTYEKLEGIISMMKFFINDDTFKVTNDGIKIDIDMVDIIRKAGGSTSEMPISALELIMDITIKDYKIAAEKLEFILKLDSAQSFENLDLDVNIQTEYKDLDYTYQIKAPVL